MTSLDAVEDGRRWGVAVGADQEAIAARGLTRPREKAPSLRTERRVIAAAKAGSERALAQLFEEHWPRAYRSAYLISRDRGAAEDIAQEAFLSAIRALDRFDRTRPFGPWLSRIVVNRAIDWTRARALRSEVGATEVGEQAFAEEGGQSSPGDPVVSEALHLAILELDLEQRTCVVLRYLLDWTPGEIAEQLGIPRGTVNSRLRRALDRLSAVVDRTEL